MWTTATTGPGARRTSSSGRALASTIRPPAAVPSSRGGIRRTSTAPIGAASIPPTSRPSTTAKFMPCRDSAARKARLAATVTTNSAACTEPTTLRGSNRPLDSSVVVATGPHPPPPAASTNPATRPSGARNRAPGRRSVISLPRRRNANRTSTYSPSRERITVIQPVASPTGSATSTTAPTTAPTAPGPARIPTVRQSTLASRQCDTPEASDVPTCAKCAEADARAGAVPSATNAVVDVRPYPMPSVPETNWAPNPASATSSSVAIPRAAARGSGRACRPRRPGTGARSRPPGPPRPPPGRPRCR